MTRLDEALEDLARGAEAPMRERLEMVPVADVGARVTRGRRRRAAGVGGGVVAGLAAVVLVATLTAGAGTREPGVSVPAGDVANGVRYELTPDSAFPEDDSQLDLRQGGTVLCGTEIDISEPVVIHARNILSREISLDVKAQVHTDGQDLLPPDFVQAGFYSLWFDYTISNSAGVLIDWQVVPLVLQDGVVVGVGRHEGTSGGGSFEVGGTAFAPLPGECDGVRTPDVTDGVYQDVLVVQGSLDWQPNPWVTFIVPGQGLNVEHQGLEEYWALATLAPGPTAGNDPSTIEHLLAATRVPLGEIPGGAGVRELTGMCERVGAAFEVDSLELVPFDAPADRPDWIFGPDWTGVRGVSWLWRERLDGVDTPWYAYGAGTTALFFDASGALVSIAAAQGNTVGTPSGAFIDQRMDFAAQPQCGITAGAPGAAGTYRVVVVIPNPADAATRLDITNVNGLELWVDLGDVVVD